jgi:hypothetical protein
LDKKNGYDYLVLFKNEHRNKDMEGLKPNKDRVPPQDATLEHAKDGNVLRVFIWLQSFHCRRVKDNLHVSS